MDTIIEKNIFLNENDRDLLHKFNLSVIQSVVTIFGAKQIHTQKICVKLSTSTPYTNPIQQIHLKPREIKSFFLLELRIKVFCFAHKISDKFYLQTHYSHVEF